MNLPGQKERVHLGVRQKMILVLLAVLTLALGTTGWYTLQEQESEITLQTKQDGERMVRLTAESLAYSVVGYDYHTIQLLLDEIVKGQDIDFARVVSGKGNVMAESGHLKINSEPWSTFRHDILFDRSVIGELTLVLDNRRIVEKLHAQRENLIRREAIIILLIAIGEFLALSYVIIRPVTMITDAMESNVDENGLITADIPYSSRDEFGRLAHQFNIMRRRLNDVTAQLHSRINSADQELRDKNERLLAQSDELQRINQELQRLTITDPLTELFNRRHFDSLLEKEFDYSRRHGDSLSIIFLDVDHFKVVNDKYGHAAGDRVLLEIAKLIRQNIRSSDAACRIGGEEFAIICRRTDKEDSYDLAEKLRQQIELHYTDIGDDVISVTASFGINTFPDSYLEIQSFTELANCADVAMYFSKEHGRNQITHHNGILNSIEGMAKKIDLQNKGTKDE